jgi:hypothetical protein
MVMSRRIFAFLVVLAISVGTVAVAPAGAARGGHGGGGVKTSIQAVDGTFEGWTTTTIGCPGVWVEAQYTVRASGLGRGTLHIEGPFGEAPWGATWTFTTQKGDELSGNAYMEVVDTTTPGIVAGITQAKITGGTGKFAGVSAGDIATRWETVGTPPPVGTCVTVTQVVQGTISGLLLYGEPPA